MVYHILPRLSSYFVKDPGGVNRDVQQAHSPEETNCQIMVSEIVIYRKIVLVG